VYNLLPMKGIEYEIESSGENFNNNNSQWRQSLEKLKHDDAVSFSVKVVEALEQKVQDHNSSCDNKVSLKQLKKVYRRAAGNVFAEVPDVEQDRGKWALARVHMYLRILKGEPMPRETHASIPFNSDEGIDLFDSVIPSEEDFTEAEKCIVAHDLFYKFTTVDSLYLEDEDKNQGYYFLD
jgi:hypothetical protein